MNYEIKELNLNMGKDEWEMYQDIPFKENGQTNDCFGLPYENFKDYLSKEISRKQNEVTYDDTPVITYIMYVNNYPVGLICLRTKIDENWLKWSGNFYYKVRKSERGKGYATKMLELAKEKFRKLNFKEIYGNSSAGNASSSGVIEANGVELLEEVNGSRYYKITL